MHPPHQPVPGSYRRTSPLGQLGLLAALSLGLILSGCVEQRGRTSSLAPTNTPVQLLVLRSREDEPERFTEILPRSLTMLPSAELGGDELGEARGRETGARSDPSGTSVVFAREAEDGNPATRDIFLASIDGLGGELRLTENGTPDDDPCFAGDGSSVLFAADRGAGSRIYRVPITGREGVPWVPTPAGAQDFQPHASPTDGRIVFRRFEPSLNRNRLILAQADGSGQAALTDGGLGSGAEAGDFDPSFSPDGDAVWFVRRGTGADRIFRLDLGSSASTPLPLPSEFAGAAAPRAGADGGLLFAALAAPSAGRPGLRAHVLDTDGSNIALLLPDGRFTSPVVEPLPGLASPGQQPAPLGAPLRVDLDNSTGQSLIGVPGLGNSTLLEDADGSPWILATTPFNDRGVAAIQLELELPVADPLDVARLRFRVVAALRRPGTGNVLRLAAFNLIERRYDTIVEVEPTGDGYTTLAADVANLAYVSAGGRAIFEIVMDVDDAAQTQLWVDQMRLDVIPYVR